MKKSTIGIIVLILVIVIITVVYFVTTGNTENLPANNEAQNEQQTQTAKYTILDEGKNMTPGQAFSSETFGEAQSLSEIPSCAFQGTDKVYNYGSYEITTSDINGQETIYSTYLLDDTIATPENVKIADDMNSMINAYGENYTQNGSEYIYTDGIVNLSFIIENNTITSIQYVMVTE